MARESYESKARREARQQDPMANLAWQQGVADVIRASGVQEIRLGDPIVQDNGWSEVHLRKLCSGTGGLGILTMHTEFKSVEPTGLNPSGQEFVGYVWRVAA